LNLSCSQLIKYYFRYQGRRSPCSLC
jgi:hypothetical protein